MGVCIDRVNYYKTSMGKDGGKQWYGIFHNYYQQDVTTTDKVLEHLELVSFHWPSKEQPERPTCWRKYTKQKIILLHKFCQILEKNLSLPVILKLINGATIKVARSSFIFHETQVPQSRETYCKVSNKQTQVGNFIWVQRHHSETGQTWKCGVWVDFIMVHNQCLKIFKWLKTK